MAYVVAVIPARAGSKGVANKNVRALAGHPLLAYSVRAALLARGIDRTLVSTDSPEYREIGVQYGAEVPFLRPAIISGDTATDLEYVMHALEWLEHDDGRAPDFIVQLRPTTPLRDPRVIERAIADIGRDEASTGLRSVHEMSETAYKAFELEGGRLKCLCSGSFDVEGANRPRQSFPKTYQANGYVDVLRTSYVRRSGKLHGNRVAAIITPRVTEVDTQEDFDLLEREIERKRAVLDTLFA